MNFQTVLEELNRLYESDELEAEKEAAAEATPVEEAIEEPAEEPIKEAAEDEAPVEESDAEEPKQLILECDKCGALVIKDESDVNFDNETGLANVEDVCAFCEETAGSKIIGAVVPYESADETVEVEETEEEEVVEAIEPEKLVEEASKEEAVEKPAEESDFNSASDSAE